MAEQMESGGKFVWEVIKFTYDVSGIFSDGVEDERVGHFSRRSKLIEMIGTLCRARG